MTHPQEPAARPQAREQVPRSTDLPAQAEPRLGVFDGRTALLIGEAVQSVAVGAGEEPRGYWPALLPESRPQRTLLLGLGGGTVVSLLRGRFRGDPLDIVGVDDDSRVLRLAGPAFGLAQEGLTIVQADAAAYLATCIQQERRFDYVIVDLFRDGAVPDAVCGRRMLGLLAGVLLPSGTLAINLNRGQRRVAQLRRLGRRFIADLLTGTGMNLVVHAHARPRRSYRRHTA